MIERVIRVPGRVNLIGEHIDYLGLPVLPMAIDRHVTIHAKPADGRFIQADAGEPYGHRRFDWTADIPPYPPGDWGNYLKAAALAVSRRWYMDNGITAVIRSDLPPAAGLSSSTALLIGCALALLECGGLRPRFEDLMDVLPEGEQYVGTRGGGMDHAVCLAAEPGCALLVRFRPLAAVPIPIPANFRVFVAHTLTTAQKSGAARENYNRRREVGGSALRKISQAQSLDGEEIRYAHHILGEQARVKQAVEALKGGDLGRFGEILNAGHASLRENLQVSCDEADQLQAACLAAGAAGARITGAGFGGCVVAVCGRRGMEEVMRKLDRDYYQNRPERRNFSEYLFAVDPAGGALYESHS